jgi:hypothetical protein
MSIQWWKSMNVDPVMEKHECWSSDENAWMLIKLWKDRRAWMTNEKKLIQSEKNHECGWSEKDINKDQVKQQHECWKKCRFWPSQCLSSWKDSDPSNHPTMTRTKQNQISNTKNSLHKVYFLMFKSFLYLGKICCSEEPLLQRSPLNLRDTLKIFNDLKSVTITCSSRWYWNQCFGSWSGLDPDSIRSVDPESDSRSGSKRSKMSHKNINILEISCFEWWMFSFEGTLQ